MRATVIKTPKLDQLFPMFPLTTSAPFCCVIPVVHYVKDAPARRLPLAESAGTFFFWGGGEECIDLYADLSIDFVYCRVIYFMSFHYHYFYFFKKGDLNVSFKKFESM